MASMVGKELEFLEEGKFRLDMISLNITSNITLFLNESPGFGSLHL